MQTKPKVSIVIIAYNEERFIKEAIESALNQTYENIEVILVDDGSKDNTVAIAKKFETRVKVISQKNSGNCSFPRNTGLANATGEYVSFLDGDDILLPNKISDQITLLQCYQEAAMVVSNYCNFKEDKVNDDHFSTCPKLSTVFSLSGDESIFLAAGSGADIMLDENFTIASSPLFRVEMLIKIGGFCTDLYACEDYHLNYRLAVGYPMVVDRNILFMRRLHDTSMSANLLKMSRFYYESRWMLLREEKDFTRKLKLNKIVKSYLIGFLRSSIKNYYFKGCVRATIGIVKFVFFKAKL